MKNYRLEKTEKKIKECIEHLEFFRKLEIFNDKDLVNKNFSPLSCGDIFEVDIRQTSKMQMQFLFSKPKELISYF